jgi:hypothetical protein
MMIDRFVFCFYSFYCVYITLIVKNVKLEIIWEEEDVNDASPSVGVGR